MTFGWQVSFALGTTIQQAMSLVGNGGAALLDLQRFLADPFLKDIVLGCLLIGFICVSVVIGIAWHIVRTLTRPKKRDHFLPLSPYALGLPAEAVSFPCRGEAHQVRGLYISAPGATSTILICPGYRRSLSDILVTCKHIWEAGHNVLAFEFYGHGHPVGTLVTLGYREVDDFLGAVAYTTLRAPMTRLGAIGYSMGAATAIMACARTNEVEALIADSSFATQWDAVKLAVRRTLRVALPAWSMRMLYRVTDFLLWLRAGYHFSQVEPIREIGQIAPRPLLLIHGLRDTIVSPQDALRLYQAAAEPKDLWLIPECEHIRGYFSDSAAYTAKVIAFFEHLKSQPSLEAFSLPLFSEQGSSMTDPLSLSDVVVPHLYSRTGSWRERDTSISENTTPSQQWESQTVIVTQEERDLK